MQYIIINSNKFLNPDDTKDREMISRMLEEIDEEEDENFELYLSNNEKDEDHLPENNSSDENTDSILFTHEKLCKPTRLQITEEALIHEPPNYNKIQTRGETKNKNVNREILHIII